MANMYANQTDRTNVKRFLENTLSILPAYMKIRWAAIIDTDRMTPVFVYPDHIHPSNVSESILHIESPIKQKYEDLDGYSVYLSIDNKYALMVEVVADVPRAPAESICEHVKLVLSQLLKTDYEEIIKT